MKLRFDISLENRAMAVKAISFWEQKHVKNKIRLIFAHDDYPIGVVEEYRNLIREVIEQSKQMNLPTIIDSKMTTIVIATGLRIYRWTEYFKKNYSLSFAERIYWTDCGAIDKVRTFKLWCLNNKTLNVVGVYNLACNYCVEEDVHILREQVPRHVLEKNAFCQSQEYGYPHLLLYYWRYVLVGNQELLYDYFCCSLNRHRREFSVMENLFFFSAIRGFDCAAKYFWNKLTVNEKQRNVMNVTELLVKYKKNPADWNETIENSVQVISLLLDEMSAEQYDAFMQEMKIDVLYLYLSTVQWQYLTVFYQILDSTWTSFSDNDFCMLQRYVLKKLHAVYLQVGTVEGSEYQRIFHFIWRKCVCGTKHKLVGVEWIMLKTLLMIDDVSSLKLIINDPDMKHQRSDILKKGKKLFFELLMDDRYELLEQFTQKVLNSETERQSFKTDILKLDNCNVYLEKSQFDQLDKYLEFLIECPKKRYNYKYLYPCNHKPEITSKIADYYVKHSHNLRTAEKKSLEFFKYFYTHSWRVNALKKHILRNDQLEPIVYSKFIEKNANYEVADAFLCWCSLSRKENRDLKTQIALKKSVKIVELEGAQEMNELLDWCFKEEEDRKRGFIDNVLLDNITLAGTTGETRKKTIRELILNCLQSHGIPCKKRTVDADPIEIDEEFMNYLKCKQIRKF